MDEAAARSILAWQYEPPYDIYNASGTTEVEVQSLVNPHHAYYAIVDEQNDLIAFCCFGQEAQVPGGDYRAAALDVGSGLRPDLTGQGLGLAIVNACLTFACTQFAPSALRVTVAAFNLRALKVWRKAGFEAVRSFQSRAANREFVILMCSA